MEKMIIRTDCISKRYGELKAVDNVSISVSKGSIYGFIGLNGAGKTTLIHMLLGMIKPSGGAAYINGGKVSAGNYRLWQDIGCFIEMSHAYPAFSVYENLDMARRLYGIKDKKAIDEVLEKMQLTSQKNKKAKALSLGNMQRLGLARALIHKPSVLLLDEPTNGLDPVATIELRELLLDLAHNQNTTILLSSHNLSEVSNIVDKIGIIHQGKLLQEIEAGQIQGDLESHFLNIINT
jgi:ABC-2 type transport system ATP-binding protein